MTPPDRYSPATCLTIWAGLAVLSWVPAVKFIAFVITHWRF